jgi:septum formation protein
MMQAHTMTASVNDVDQPLILASSSPRRRQLLELIGLPFQVVPPGTDEQPRAGEEPISFAQRAAHDKAVEVANRQPGGPVLGADTVVEIDRTILGKPGSPAAAEEMLRTLSGREHLVHTAVALVSDGSCYDIVDTAQVRCVHLSERVISWYVGTGEPLDKAGAYAVQGLGGLLVEKVEGSPYTVVGLPIHRLPELFATHKLDFWSRLNV